MKRYQLWLTTLVMVCILCACGGGAETSQEGQETSEPSPQETVSMQELSGIIALERLTDYLDDVLVAPDSLEFLAVTSVNEGESFGLQVDYSAENRMGGRDRETVYMETRGILMCDCDLFDENPVSASVTREHIVERYNEAVENGAEEVELDVDKLMENMGLDDEIRKEIFYAYEEAEG